MNQEKTKKKGIIIAGISAIVLVAVLGISFAVWNYSRTTDNQILVAGDIYMKFKETPALTIENAIPSEGPGEKYFEFTIEGKNTYSKPIWYEIDLQYGENHATRKTRIKDNLLKFRLVEIKDGSEQTVVDNASYNNLTNKKIWVNTIAANTRSKVEITYRLYMWISSDTIIGNTSDAVYDMETWNNDIYASIKVNVSGDFNEKELEEEAKITLVDEVKSKLVKYEESSQKGFSGGLVAINTDGTLYNETNNETIREYRYNGNTVNNYVKFNNELWRIVGVFKEDEEEIVKIVRDEVLPTDYLPETYTISGTTYKIKIHDNYVYWNYIVGESATNDWTTAGIQYYLNTESDTTGQNKGYLNYISEDSKKMIRTTRYYLGAVTADMVYVGGGNYGSELDNTIESYINERSSKTWLGKIGLLYPSDAGYTSTYIYSGDRNEYTDTLSWQKEYNNTVFDYVGWVKDKAKNGHVSFISPSSCSAGSIFEFHIDTFYTYIYSQCTGSNWTTLVNQESGYSILPTLYLQSTVKVTNGNGTENSPYELSL